jgi:hypothetical protein
MATGKWFKDSCPYCKDQGFNSVIGDVEAGETIFGFAHTQVATADKITFSTATSGRVTQMVNTDYHVEATRVNVGSAGASEASVSFVYDQHLDYFYLAGEVGDGEYEVIVRGRVLQ